VSTNNSIWLLEDEFAMKQSELPLLIREAELPLTRRNLEKLLAAKKIDILGAQEVKSHMPISISGYDWIPGLESLSTPRPSSRNRVSG
jgi:hypothetical protein